MSQRNYQLTLNEVQRFEPLKQYLLSLKNLAYAIAAQEEAPLTGHEHIHIYAQFSKPQRLSIKKIEGAHIEKCFGSADQNIEYVKKGGNIIWEHGEPLSNVSTRFPSIKEVEAMSIEERKQLPIQYYNIVEKMNRKEQNKISIDEYHKLVTVVYYWGKSGVGKTKTAVQYIKELGYKEFNEVKYENGFWNGTGDAECALYDDFRDSHMKPTEFINFIDYNVHNMNIKGGVHKNKYRHIFITSIQDPEQIYKQASDEYREQWLRRMEIRHIE